MFDSETDNLNWVNVSRQLFCDDFRTNLFSWLTSALIRFKHVKLKTVSMRHSHSLQ